MTHSTSTTSGTPNMASLLARVPAESAPDPQADTKETSKTATDSSGNSSTGSTSAESVSPAGGITKGVPAKRLLIWAVPLVLLAVGAAIMHQSPVAGSIFLLLAFIVLIVALIAKWLGKRRAARAATNRGPGANGPSRRPGAGRSPGGSRGLGGGGRGGLLSKINPFRKRSAAGGPGSTGSGQPAGGKPPASGRGAPGRKGGMLSRLNPLGKRGAAAAGTPGSKPGAKTPASGKPSGPSTSPVGAPARPKGLRGKLRNLLPGGSPGAPGGGKSPAGGRAPSGGRTLGAPGDPGGPNAVGGGTPGLGIGDQPGRFRDRFRLRSRAKAAIDNPNNWRNSGARWEQRFQPFRRGSDVPRNLAPGDSTQTPPRNPADSTSHGEQWRTREGNEYRGGGQRESFAASDSDGGSDRQPSRPVVTAYAERIDQSANSSPTGPISIGLGPATNTSNTDSHGGDTMAHTDGQTGARSATILEAGASTARAGAARKENVAATHRRQAAAASGIPEMAGDAAVLRAQAARASVDAGARRGIGAAFSQAAATHRGN